MKTLKFNNKMTLTVEDNLFNPLSVEVSKYFGVKSLLVQEKDIDKDILKSTLQIFIKKDSGCYMVNSDNSKTKISEPRIYMTLEVEENKKQVQEPVKPTEPIQSHPSSESSPKKKRGRKRKTEN